MNGPLTKALNAELEKCLFKAEAALKRYGVGHWILTLVARDPKIPDAFTVLTLDDPRQVGALVLKAAEAQAPPRHGMTEAAVAPLLEHDDNVCRGCGTPWGMRHAETCTNAAHPPRAKPIDANPEGPQG